MATEVNESETLTLVDGSEVTVKPLNIRLLRKFMTQMNKMGELEDDSQALDVLLVACAIGFKGSDRPELGNIFEKNDKGKEDFESVNDESAEELEEYLTLPLMQKIAEVAGGMQNDPNQTVRGLPGQS